MRLCERTLVIGTIVAFVVVMVGHCQTASYWGQPPSRILCSPCGDWDAEWIDGYGLEATSYHTKLPIVTRHPFLPLPEPEMAGSKEGK
jgi:hypothetical protein